MAAGRLIHVWIRNQLKTPKGLIGNTILPWLWNRRNAALNDATLTALAPDSTDRILEIGFGGGYLLGRLGAEVTDGYVVGIDASRILARRGEKRFRRRIQAEQMEILCTPVEKLPFPDASFNKVCSVNSIFYWTDIQKGLAEIHRVLQADGRFVLTFTAEASLKNRYGFSQSFPVFDRESMKSVLSGRGFRHIRCETHEDSHRVFHTCLGVK
ncbi:methyltransferase domain-containing protein [bacterium]|nr:methyltransferase domain-containing protein [bacterium]